MPASFAPISTDDQHRERRELHRPPVDHRLEEVVLELLVDDEEDDDDDPGGDRVQERDRADDDRGDRRAGERDQVEDRDDHAERDRDTARRVRAGTIVVSVPGDQADQQVAGHVAADRAVDVVADARQRGCDRSGSRP